MSTNPESPAARLAGSIDAVAGAGLEGATTNALPAEVCASVRSTWIEPGPVRTCALPPEPGIASVAAPPAGGTASTS